MVSVTFTTLPRSPNAFNKCSPIWNSSGAGGDNGLADAYLRALEANPLSPPAPDEFQIGEHLLNALGDLGRVVKVTDTIAFAPAAYREMVDQVMTYLDEHGSITLAAFRDLFGTSRKYAQAVLEHFDQQRLTRRVG